MAARLEDDGARAAGGSSSTKIKRRSAVLGSYHCTLLPMHAKELLVGLMLDCILLQKYRGLARSHPRAYLQLECSCLPDP